MICGRGLAACCLAFLWTQRKRWKPCVASTRRAVISEKGLPQLAALVTPALLASGAMQWWRFQRGGGGGGGGCWLQRQRACRSCWLVRVAGSRADREWSLSAGLRHLASRPPPFGPPYLSPFRSKHVPHSPGLPYSQPDTPLVCSSDSIGLFVWLHWCPVVFVLQGGSGWWEWRACHLSDRWHSKHPLVPNSCNRRWGGVLNPHWKNEVNSSQCLGWCSCWLIVDWLISCWDLNAMLLLLAVGGSQWHGSAVPAKFHPPLF